MTVAPEPIASASAETPPLIQIKRLRRRATPICGSARLRVVLRAGSVAAD